MADGFAGVSADTSSYPKPAAPTSALDIAGKLGGLQRQSIDIDQAKLNLYNQHHAIMNDELSTLANDPNITKDKVLQRLNATADMLNMPAPVRQKMLNEFAPLQTSDQIRRQLEYSISRGQSISERVNSLYGVSGNVDNGQTVTPSRTFRSGGPVPSGAPIAKQLSPETDVNRPTIDPNTGQPTGGYEPAKLGNVPIQIPPGSRLAPGGFPGQFLPINRDPNSLPTNPRMLPGETPRAVNPGPIESPNSRVRSGFQDAYGNPPVARGPATQPPVGEPEAIKGELAESQRQANDLSAAANETRNTKALIGNLRNTLKGFTPGPLADYSRIGRSLAANVVPDSWKKEGGFLDPKSIASQEEFNKFAQQIAQSQFKQLGGTGTNAHLDSVQHTSPNEFMSKLGIQGVLGFLDGNQDAIEMKNKEWRNWRSKGNSVQTWPAFNQKFNETFDPRVFQLKYLAPKERREYVDSITTPDEAQSFVRAFHHAKTKGWINYEIPK